LLHGNDAFALGGAGGTTAELNNLKTLVLKLCSEYTILRYVLPSSNYRMNSDFREVTVAYAILRTAKLKVLVKSGAVFRITIELAQLRMPTRHEPQITLTAFLSPI
jgi:hypothetical protein